MFAIMSMIFILLAVFLFLVDNYMFRVGGGTLGGVWGVLGVESKDIRKAANEVVLVSFGCILHFVVGLEQLNAA